MFKTCPSCHQEYQQWVSVCADCNVALEFAAETPPGPALPPPENLVLLKLEDPWYLRELAEMLQHQGISSRIDAEPPGSPIGAPKVTSREGSRGRTTRLGIYVRAEDLQLAHAIAEELATARLPDLPATAAAPDASACPACGEPLSERATACAECGLEFPEAEFSCFVCGHHCPAGTRRCPECGTDFEEDSV